VIGREFSAVVREVHPSVNTLKLGSRIVSNPIVGCGACHMCAADRPNLSLRQSIVGYDIEGGMISSLVVCAKRCYEIADSLPLDIAALVEPLSVAWHGVEQSGWKKGQAACVIGTGPIGVTTVACLKARGVDRIAVVGRPKERNETVKRLGVESVIESSTEDVSSKVKELFDG